MLLLCDLHSGCNQGLPVPVCHAILARTSSLCCRFICLATLLLFAFVIISRDPFTAQLRYKLHVKSYAMFLSAFVAIMVGVATGAALTDDPGEGQAATVLAVISFFGTIGLILTLGVTFIISVLQPPPADARKPKAVASKQQLAAESTTRASLPHLVQLQQQAPAGQAAASSGVADAGAATLAQQAWGPKQQSPPASASAAAAFAAVASP